MSGYGKDSRLAAYQGVSVRGTLAGADPHGLIQMLMDGALERLSIARGCMERGCKQRGDISRKTAALHQCINIVAELRGSLDVANGGILSQNLNDLYDYILRQLLRANCDNDVKCVIEASSLLGEIRSAWVAIAPEVRSANRVPLKAPANTAADRV